jgi:hypothetical protein
MSTYLSTLRTFKAETNRISGVPDAEFKQFIGTISDICPGELGLLWRVLNDHVQQCMLFEELSPAVVSDALECMPDDLKTQALIDMSTERRLSIVETWSPQKQQDELKDLDYQRQIEEYSQGGTFPFTFVMTGQVPSNYPSSMGNCVFCGNSYRIWESIFTFSCQTHSSCKACYPGHYHYC